MPAKPRWLLHIPEILDELRSLSVPIVDRALCEKLFRLGRRRTLEVLSDFGGYRAGNTILVDRQALIASLEDLWESPDTTRERQRKARLVERLESLRRYRKAASVVIPMEPAAKPVTLPSWPNGIALESGRLTVEYGRAEELLQRLYQIAQAAAGDYETFQATVEHSMRSAG